MSRFNLSVTKNIFILIITTLIFSSCGGGSGGGGGSSGGNTCSAVTAAATASSNGGNTSGNTTLASFSAQNDANPTIQTAAERKKEQDSENEKHSPLEPRAEPYALNANSGMVPVRFSVWLKGKSQNATSVVLRRLDTQEEFVMNDQGKDGDHEADDGVYTAHVLIDTTKEKTDTCLSFEALANNGSIELTSPPLRLCVSSFPVRIAKSDKSKLLEFPDGSKAIADEISIRVTPTTSYAEIKALADSINAIVVGSILPLHTYQLKLKRPVTASRLLEIVDQLKSRPGVIGATVNAIGSFSSSPPSDPQYISQHGLQLVRAQDVWDANATGSGVTVIVLDTGIDRTHPDFGSSPGNCQLADDDCGMASTDALGHGTQVAGIIAAKTNNALGVAGIAYGSKIKSIKVTDTVAITLAQMEQGFIDAGIYISSHPAATVINASFSGVNVFANWDLVCLAIDHAVWNGTVRAVVVNASGNDNTTGAVYPGRCNDLNANLDPSRKNLLIPVANSTSVDTPDCGNVAIDQRCANSIDGTMSGSNYGAWVDMTAPGSAILSTTLGGGYNNTTGSSFSSPTVAAAVAILKSCGVPLTEIESTLRTSANVTVTFPDASSAPRLDIYRALQSRNLAPTALALSSNSLATSTNTTAGVEVGTLTTTDPNTCDKFTYSIVGGADAAKFSIGGSSADRLKITDGVLNFSTKPTYSVIVRVTDFFGQTFDKSLTVNVTRAGC